VATVSLVCVQCCFLQLTGFSAYLSLSCVFLLNHFLLILFHFLFTVVSEFKKILTTALTVASGLCRGFVAIFEDARVGGKRASARVCSQTFVCPQVLLLPGFNFTVVTVGRVTLRGLVLCAIAFFVYC
jgi:hypothetical protein